jgi:hypothetical protein
MALAYFYNRKAAIPYEMERTPDDFNRRVVKNHCARAAYSRASGPGREANISEGHALIKNSTLIFLDKCGHFQWLETAKETWKNRERIPSSAALHALPLLRNPAC